MPTAAPPTTTARSSPSRRRGGRPRGPGRLQPRRARDAAAAAAPSPSAGPSPTPAPPPPMRPAGPTRSCSAPTARSATRDDVRARHAASIPARWPRRRPTPAPLSVVLPTGFDGTGHISVLTDRGGAVTEPDRGHGVHHRPGRRSPSPRPIRTWPPRRSRRPGDRAMTATASPSPGACATWATAPTAATAGWTDRVYLSLTDSVDGSSILLGEVPHTRRARGRCDLHRVTAQFALPGDCAGAYHVLVVTDANGARLPGRPHRQRHRRGVQHAAGRRAAAAGPRRDRGQPADATRCRACPTTVSFTVTNIGEAIARGPWTDQLVLLYGANLASSATLASVVRARSIWRWATATRSPRRSRCRRWPTARTQIAVMADSGAQCGRGGARGQQHAGQRDLHHHAPRPDAGAGAGARPPSCPARRSP